MFWKEYPVPVRLKRLAETMLKTRDKLKPPNVGDMTQRVEAGVSWTQAFNAENRLSEISNGTDTWTFTYNGDGNRVKQVNPDGSVTLFLGGGLYTVEDAAGSPQITKYYSIARQRVAMYDGDGLRYLLTDHLGSIVAVTDANGDLVGNSEQRYMPFGEPRLEASSPTDFGYTGQRSLADAGLMDYNARWYDAALGRFISADSLVPGAGNPQAFNRYAYVVNNPMRLVDPSGRRPCSDEWGCFQLPQTNAKTQITICYYCNSQLQQQSSTPPRATVEPTSPRNPIRRDIDATGTPMPPDYVGPSPQVQGIPTPDVTPFPYHANPGDLDDPGLYFLLVNIGLDLNEIVTNIRVPYVGIVASAGRSLNESAKVGLPLDIAIGRAMLDSGEDVFIDNISVAAGAGVCAGTVEIGCIPSAFAVYGSLEVVGNQDAKVINTVLYPVMDFASDYIGDLFGVK